MSTGIEDMTLGELARRVEAANRRAEERYEREQERYAQKISQEIWEMIQEALPRLFTVDTKRHSFIKAGRGESCARCQYHSDHPIHEDVPKVTWQPPAAE